MKNTFALLCLLSVGLFSCQPKRSVTVTSNVCAACDTNTISHLPDGLGVFYYVPTAFTPNGDGINDVFWIYSDGLNTDSSIVAIYDKSGKLVFQGKVTDHWDGRDLNGAACAAGRYPVSLKLYYGRTPAVTRVDICACVSLLAYTGSCLNTAGYPYHFPDQVNVDSGFVYPTAENICP